MYVTGHSNHLSKLHVLYIFRNILQLEKVSFERKRKRPRKDDMDNDGGMSDLCSKSLASS